MDDTDSFGEQDIAIVGMGLHVPGARTPEQFWNNLRDGVEFVQSVSEEELQEAGVSPYDIQDPRYVPKGVFLDKVADFDPEFFGLGPKEAAIMDPQHRHFLEVCWEALERAGHPPSKFDGAIGVFGGCGMGKYMTQNLLSNKELVDSIGYFLLRHTGNDKDFLTTRVAYTLDLSGPAIGIQTACSTSLVAIHVAVQSLLSGECDMALAGGVTIEFPQKIGYLYVENEILSPDGHCRAFDHRAEGTIFGSGAGVVALRRLEDALEDGDQIDAIIKGSAVNNDGSRKVGYLAPSVDGQAAAVSEALAVSDTPAETIGYIEAHGTGTAMGDPIEVSALTEAFRDSTSKNGFCGIGSVKTNIGHLDTAAGVVSLIKAVLALKNSTLPPSLNWEAPNPNIDFENSPFYVNNELQPWPESDIPRRAGVNSLGVGGTNAFVVLEQAPLSNTTAVETHNGPVLLQISARNRNAIDDYSKALKAYLQTEMTADIRDIAYTLREARHDFQYRRVLACHSKEEAIELLEDIDPFRVFTHISTSEKAAPIFLLPGGGAQYLGMGAGLYENDEVFHRELERCIEIVANTHQLDLKPFLFAKDPNDPKLIKAFERPSIQLPAILAIEYALAKLWISHGIAPQALLGHSMGENTAACLAGVLSLEDALGLVCLRGRLFETVPDGGMLSVLLNADETRSLLTGALVLAVENAPELSVVSGPSEEITRFMALLEEREIDATRIPINIAAHSPMLDSILEAFHAYLSGITLSAPQIPFISNRTGTWINEEQATSPEYWVEHLRGTVHFSAGLASVFEKFPESLLIETGPGSTLSSLAKLQPAFDDGVNVVTSLRHRDQEIADDLYFFTALGRLWASGQSTELLRLKHDGQKISLPTYAFQHARYWIDPGKAETSATATILKRQEDISQWYYEPVWEPGFARPSRNQGQLSWLVFMDELGLGERLAIHLRGTGHSVITVRNSERNATLTNEEYLIDSDRGAEGYQDMVTSLAENKIVIDRILYLWTLTGEEAFRTALNMTAHNIERSFYSLFYLFRALGERDALSNVHVITVSNGARQVFDEAVPAPEKATLDGPCMAVPHEYPGFSCTSIDLDLFEDNSQRSGLFSRKGSETSDFERILIEEISAKVASSKIAYRNGVRYRLAYHKLAEQPVAKDLDANLQGVVSGGVYLITGGLGGLGLTMAESLALTPGVHLLLVSRSGLIPRKDWQSWISTHDENDKVYQTISRIQRLEALGASVKIAAIDITDHEQLTEFIAQEERTAGPVRGVIHAAGVIHDDLLVLKSIENVESVFAPKIYGTMVLDMVFREKKLDFMFLFSSSSTVTAPPGQVDYVAANAYLNEFAASRSVRKSERVIALCWGVWNEVGIAAQAMGDTIGSTVPTLHPLLSRRRELSDALIYDLVPISPETHWILNEHRLTDGRPLIPGTAFIELANHVLSDLSSSTAGEICELEFNRPLAVEDQDVRIARIKVSDAGDERLFALQSLMQGEDGHFGWLTHGQAKLRITENVEPTSVNIQAIRDRCPLYHRQSKQGALKTAQAAHVLFGPRWDVLKEQGYGESEAYALLELPDEYCDELKTYPLHPALLDIATGHAMRLIDAYVESESCLWVPVSYERIKIYASLQPSIISWVRNHGANHNDDATASFDITIAGLDGHVLMDIENFTIQKAPPGDLLASLVRIESDALEPDRMSPVRRTDSDAITPAEKQLRYAVSQGIRPSEGMKVFRHLVEECSQNRVVVSSLDLDELQKQLTEPADNNSQQGSSFERPQLESEYLAPETENQIQLANLWQELLGIGSVGIHDSFFDLGGHSLIAVRLFAKIKKTWGVNLPVSALLEFPTIEGLSLKLPALSDDAQANSNNPAEKEECSHEEPSQWSSLVALKKTGSRLPFFCVAGKGGNPMNLRHLVKHLDQDQPFYGIQHRGVDGLQPVHETIEEMATECIHDIRAMQPVGPYQLGGFSGGGLVAFEMAKQLEKAGEQISLLALFDTPSPTRLYRSKKEKLALHAKNLRQQGPTYIFEKLGGHISRVLSSRSQPKLPEGIQPGGTQSEQEIAPHVAVGQAWERMEHRYAQSSWNGAAVLFRPYLISANDLDIFLNEDKFNGWSDFLQRGINVVELPGGHSTMFEEPHVRILADRLEKTICSVEVG